MPLLQFFNPSPPQLFGLVSVLITVFCFGCYGALAGGRNRFAATDIFAGWGLVTGAFTVVGVVFDRAGWRLGNGYSGRLRDCGRGSGPRE